ncbi:hypothetical protein CYMTET_4782, partial [Cymbomonas tetramitiformis]
MMELCDFDNDILTRLLLHLDSWELIQCEAVCKRFRILATQPHLWANLSLRSCPKPLRVNLHVILRLIARSLSNKQYRLRILDLSGCGNTDFSDIKFLEKCPCLTHLKIGGCRPLDEKVVVELEKKQLEVLEVSLRPKKFGTTEESAQRVCNWLQTGTVRVIELDLSNKIHREQDFGFLYTALKFNHSITRLDLSGAVAASPGKKNFAEV